MNSDDNQNQSQQSQGGGQTPVPPPAQQPVAPFAPPAQATPTFTDAGTQEPTAPVQQAMPQQEQAPVQPQAQQTVAPEAYTLETTTPVEPVMPQQPSYVAPVAAPTYTDLAQPEYGTPMQMGEHMAPAQPQPQAPQPLAQPTMPQAPQYTAPSQAGMPQQGGQMPMGQDIQAPVGGFQQPVGQQAQPTVGFQPQIGQAQATGEFQQAGAFPAPPPEDITPANFQLGTKLPAQLNVPVPEHNLSFDTNAFIRLLAGSISLSRPEKRKIIESIPKLKQSQIDELVRIFEEEKQKFAMLSKKHVPQLEKLADQHYNDWMDLEAEFVQSKKSEEDTSKADEIRKSLGL
jgi:hypothetical protein